MYGHALRRVSLRNGPHSSLLFRRKYLLNADLINQMLSAQIRQMRFFLVIRQVRTDPLGRAT